MSILDDAIREHLELKRAHGADDAELKKLEDEAFGPAERPGDAGSFNEAPTEFLAAPASDAAEVAAEAKADTGERRMPNIADLQEGPPTPAPEASAEVPVIDAPSEEASAADASSDAEDEGPPETHPEQQTMPVPHPEPPMPEPAAEATPAPEAPEAPPEPPKADTGPNTAEREAIADQPTEFFDVEANLTSGSEQSPTDEQLLDSKLSEPRLAPSDPITEDPIAAEPATPEPISEEYEEDDDFFSEQRLSDELNQALEAPVTDEHEIFPQTEESTPPPAPITDEHAAEPAAEAPSEEHTAIYDFDANREEDSGEHDLADEDEDGDEKPSKPSTDPEDVLEDTPEFLEDAPEDDELWFEQKPPKDFDFDD